VFWVLLVLGLLTLVSLVPLSVDLVVESEGQLRATAKARWGALPLGTIRAGAARTRTTKNKTARAHRERARGRPQLHKVRALLTSDDFLASIGRWLARVLRLLAPENVSVHLRFGAGDPYETGQVWASVSALFAALDPECFIVLDLEPDFVDEVFHLDARATFHLVPFLLLATLLGYLLSPPPWRAVRAYARA
jgi:hypothetical protein